MVRKQYKAIAVSLGLLALWALWCVFAILELVPLIRMHLLMWPWAIAWLLCLLPVLTWATLVLMKKQN